MSAVLDFRELRDKVLAGEMDEEEEPVENPQKEEFGSAQVLIPLCATAGTLGIIGYDKWGNSSAMFGPTGTMGLLGFSGLMLGLSVGAYRRGMEAQTEKDRYEKLLNESQSIIEGQQEEIDSMEAEADEKEAEEQQEAENDYQYDYLSAEDSFFHGPSLGMGVGAFGQEGVLYRPKDPTSLW